MTRVKIGPPRETHPPKRRAIFGAALAVLALSAPIHVSAQSNAEVVANCGTPNETYNVGQHMPQTQNTSGQNCTTGGGGGGGSVTIAAPLGAGADSTGVTVTLSTSGITDLSNTSTNTGTTATEIGATTSPAAGSVNGQLGTLIGKTGISSAALVSYQQTTTASAVQMASNALANGIVCQALTTNTGTDYIGPSGVTTGTGYPLVAGQAISYGVANSNQLYLIGSNTSDVVACTGN